MHLVPQVIIDLTETLKDTGNPNTRENYLTRLEAIKDYCEYVIAREKAPKTIHAAKKK